MISKITSSTVNACREFYENIPSTNQLLKNINKVALPAIALVAASNAGQAQAGPWSGAMVILACLPLIECPPLYTACLVTAGATFALPTP